MKMKLLAILSVVTICTAAAEVTQESEIQQTREKRGLLAAPIPISYSSQYIHHTPSVAVSYHAPIAKVIAPLPPVKVIQPLPLAKVLAPAVSYTKIAYPSVLPYYGFSHGYAHGYGHGFGYFH